MKKQSSIILGLISACCLFSVHVRATEKTTAEKHCCTTKVPTCAACPTPTYATLVQSTRYPSGSGVIQTSQITVPFNAMQTARGITFDETVATDSFILPKGVYCFKFQFSLVNENTTTTPNLIDERTFRFTDMYLDINNDSARIALDWNMRLNDGSNIGFNQYFWASFFGSKNICIGSDNTVVKFILVRDPDYLGDLVFTYDPTGPFTLTTNNSPVRINIYKIGGCPQ